MPDVKEEIGVLPGALLGQHSLQRLPIQRGVIIGYPQAAIVHRLPYMTRVMATIGRAPMMINNRAEVVGGRLPAIRCGQRQTLGVGDKLVELFDAAGRIIDEPLQLQDQHRWRHLDAERLCDLGIDDFGSTHGLQRIPQTVDLLVEDLQTEAVERLCCHRVLCPRPLYQRTEPSKKEIADGRLGVFHGPGDGNTLLPPDFEPLSTGAAVAICICIPRVAELTFEDRVADEQLLVQLVQEEGEEFLSILLRPVEGMTVTADAETFVQRFGHDRRTIRLYVANVPLLQWLVLRK